VVAAQPVTVEEDVYQLIRLLRHAVPRPLVGACVGLLVAVGATVVLLARPAPTSTLDDRAPAADAVRMTGPASRDTTRSPVPAEPTPPVPTSAAPVAPPGTAAPSPRPAASPVPTTAPVRKRDAPAPPPAKTLDYEFEAQITYYYCGPAAVRLAVTARHLRPSQDELAARLGTTESGTNSAEDTTRVLNALVGAGSYRTRAVPGPGVSAEQVDRLRADVVRAVSRGFPVVVNIVGDAVDTDGGWHSYPGGHYLTVVGYRDGGRTVRIADPAIVGPGSEYWMSTADLAQWAASRGYSA
jgi:hypothetical protein